MPILKMITGKYENNKAVDNLLNYIADELKTCELVGSYNILPCFALEIINATQQLYNQTDGKHVIHFVLSVTKKDCCSANDLYYIAYNICLFFQKYHVVFGVHSDTQNLHVHFMVNPISFVDGTRLISNKELLLNLHGYCLQYFDKVQIV